MPSCPDIRVEAGWWQEQVCRLVHFAYWSPGPVGSVQAINAGEGVEKREPSYTVGGNAN